MRLYFGPMRIKSSEDAVVCFFAPLIDKRYVQEVDLYLLF